MPASSDNIAELVTTALGEDMGSGDLTASLLESRDANAHIICREDAILCGQAWFDEVFRQLDRAIRVSWCAQDGDRLGKNQQVCALHGDIRALLSGERTALNFLQTLSATATQTARYISAIAHTKCRILDTRKTLPGLRGAQKYAVRCGGGINHRIGLFDAILIKENHITAAGSIHEAMTRARAQHPDTFVEIEVENLQELEQAMDCAPDRILLDNFSIKGLQQAVRLNAGRSELEASGNITLQNIAEIAETGVQFISIGSITKHIRAIDLSMQIIE